MHGVNAEDTDASSRAEHPSEISFDTHVALSDRFVPSLCSRNAPDDILRIERILLEHYDPDQQKWIGWAWAKDQKSFKLSDALQTLNSFCTETEFLPLEDIRVELPRSDETISDSKRFLGPVILCDELISPVLVDSLQPFAARAKLHLSRWMFLQHVYGILLSGSSMVFIRLDRAGVVLSNEIDIHQNPKVILQALFGCLALAKDSLDASISWTGDHFLFARREGNQSSDYILEEPLFHNPRIPGSGARVFLVHDESNPETQLVLKDWWRDNDAVDEGKLLCEVSGLFGLPEYHSHWTVGDASGDPQTTHFIGDSLLLHPAFSGNKDNENYDHEREQSEDETPVELERRLLIHSRLLSTVRGEHLLKFRNSPRVVLNAIHDAILGHWSLFEAGYLHDDVSYGNILVLPSPMPAAYYGNYSKLPVPPLLDQCTAILIDFDTAIPIAELTQGRQLLRPKTKKTQGTAVYMSTRIMEGSKTFGSWAQDDLESFLWVLIVTAFWVKPPSSGYADWSVEHTMKICLFPDGPGKDKCIRDHKLSLLVALSGESHRPFSYADTASCQYHEVIKKWCTYSLDRYFTSKKAREEKIVRDEQIYLDVLGILREAIASIP
ncbi:hypothetical protein SISSUDRAFT_1127649 [Sistotremastrum suecicum HHB10207 ss-3]|uniref:Fungal-type protein kinase domain-containing protein n=1 Tax=Sistotremastrum suecicum HHB10207 ss-3 TaxID=1314776 RepID=A0A166ETE6_9AGAM|nr:hypothetical protein SISSUDRAFT_1127649 [Sistotremastrum suecicum HHB10207 ss-3]